MTPSSLPEEGQALRRLLGDEPFVTPDSLAAFGSWMLAKLKEHTEEQPSTAGQVWATCKQIQKRYGISKSRANDWLANLTRNKKVRTQKPYADKRGMYYHLGDIEAAFSENCAPK